MELQSTGPLTSKPQTLQEDQLAVGLQEAMTHNPAQAEDREAPRLKPAQAEDQESDSAFIMTLPEDKVPPGPTKMMFNTMSTEEDREALILFLNPACAEDAKIPILPEKLERTKTKAVAAGFLEGAQQGNPAQAEDKKDLSSFLYLHPGSLHFQPGSQPTCPSQSGH